MIYPSIRNELSKAASIVVAFFLSVLIGRIAYAQSDTPKFSKEFICSIMGNCLVEPYRAKKWSACAVEANANLLPCNASKDNACTARFMKITELSVESTRYGPLFTLLISGNSGNDQVFRYTAHCHLSKSGELIEFKKASLR